MKMYIIYMLFMYFLIEYGLWDFVHFLSNQFLRSDETKLVFLMTRHDQGDLQIASWKNPRGFPGEVNKPAQTGYLLNFPFKNSKVVQHTFGTHP